MKKQELFASLYNKEIQAELTAQCAENIKMMILDEYTKVPKVHSGTAIEAILDEIYEWPYRKADEMSFNIVPFGADKRFSWPDRYQLITVNYVEHYLDYGKGIQDTLTFMIHYIVSVLEGLSFPFEVRRRVPKNVYWEALFNSNSLLTDYLPDRVIRQLFERDESDWEQDSGHYNPHIGYLRLLHNAMAWVTLFDEMDEYDEPSQEENLYSILKGYRRIVGALLSELWEPIDSLREFYQYGWSSEMIGERVRRFPSILVGGSHEI